MVKPKTGFCAAHMQHSLMCIALGAMACALLPSGVTATPVCRWVDEAGQTQLSDVVPDRYAGIATCTDSRQYELNAQQRLEAEQRAASESERARVATPPAAALPPVTGTQPKAAGKRPSEVVTDATSCPTWWRLYDESGECFGPYRTAQGGVKQEAFDQCNEVPSPEVKCGPRRD